MGAEDTKSRIRAVAVELFTTQGYEQTSLREIADRVGMTKASLYYHYPSKQALLVALIEPLVDDIRHATRSIQALPHTPENVRWALGQFLDVMVRHGDACALMMRDVPAVLAAVAPVWEDLIALTRDFNTWLAGPDASDAERIRALAATEVLGAAVSANIILRDLSADVLRDTLLGCATAALGVDTPAVGTPAVAPPAKDNNHDQGVLHAVRTT